MIHHSSPAQSIEGQGQDTPKFADFPEVDLNDLLNSEPQKQVIGDSQVAVGIWIWNFKAGKWSLKGLYQNGFFALLESKGYYKRYSSNEKSVFWIKDTDGIIEEVTMAHLVDVAKDYVAQQGNIEFEHDGQSLTATAALCQEKFKMQFFRIFNPNSLLNMTTHKKEFFEDTETSSFFFYENAIVEVTADEVTLHPYQLLNKRCVWKSQVIHRVFDLDAEGKNSHMALFDFHTCNGLVDRLNTRRTGCGYALHRYNSPMRNQAIICNDEIILSAKEARGRTGKGLWYRALKQIRPVCLIDGKAIKPDNQFWLQLVEPYHCIVCIDDPNANFDFKRLFSAMTEGLTIELKREKSIQIAPSKSPKFLILSNIILDNSGTSNKARQFVIEFGNHYSKQIINGTEEPIIDEHGCVFFSDDWDVEEWARFDQYMISNVQLYLKYGLVAGDMSNVAANRLRQTTGDDFFEFVNEYENGLGLQADTFYDSTDLFQKYKTLYQVGEKELQQRGFTNHLKKYAASKEWTFQRRKGGPSGGFWFVSKKEKTSYSDSNQLKN